MGVRVIDSGSSRTPRRQRGGVGCNNSGAGWGSTDKGRLLGLAQEAEERMRRHDVDNRRVAFATVVFGYQLYQERQKTTGIKINVGKSEISIEQK